MARAKKTEEKPKEGATLQIDVDSFVRTRDSVVTGLATLQDAIQTLSTAYIKHTNAVLGEHGAGLDVDSALAKLGENPLLRLGDLNRPISPARSVGGDGASDKKERKKRQHDPNAPKRPLTPFFLYMQTARPIIAHDLGPDVAKGAVSLEGTRRWTVMPAKDKALWTLSYKDNLRLYNARMHAYKAGDFDAKDMTEEEAGAYAEANNIPVIAMSNETAADAQLLGESSAAVLADEDEDAEGEPEIQPTPPPKTPKPSTKRNSRSSKKTTSAEPSSIAPPSANSIYLTSEKESSPAKKRKRSSKKGVVDDIVATTEREDATIEMPKSAPKKRKTKSKGDA